jgi:hypothetical protein
MKENYRRHFYYVIAYQQTGWRADDDANLGTLLFLFVFLLAIKAENTGKSRSNPSVVGGGAALETQ